MANGITSEKYIEMVRQEREARAARVRRFIAEHDENEVADLFDAMRDMIDEREADETFYLQKFFRHIIGIVDDIEESFCN